jgi:hypothetical protein
MFFVLLLARGSRSTHVNHFGFGYISVGWDAFWVFGGHRQIYESVYNVLYVFWVKNDF